MAKASGNTRLSYSKYKWSQSYEYNDILNDATNIFIKEAKKGLGSNFMQRKPYKVSETEYDKLLASGEYIEVLHGGNENHVNQMLNGKYYINKDLHVDGFGYYFANESGAGSYAASAYRGKLQKALIRKSDILQNVTKADIEDGANKYLGKNAFYKQNKRHLEYSDKSDYFNKSTVAASKGYKAVRGKAGNIIVIDRSVLIIKKS